MRKWCVVFTAVAFAVLLGGCGKSASDKNTKKETEKVKETAAQAITEVQTEAPAEAVLETEALTEAMLETEALTEAVLQTKALTETVNALPAEAESEELQESFTESSENKLNAITSDGEGISLNTSTISFTKWGETFQLTATVTPSDTTDELTWSSSDQSVATVSSDGVVTSNGVGNTTITAQCGDYSASCSVSSVVIFSEASDLLRVDGYGVIADSYTEGNDAAKFIDNPTFAQIGYGLEAGILSDYEVAVNSSETVGSKVYGIPIPANANKLFITLPDTTGQNLRLLNVSYHNSESLQTSVAGVTACKYENFKTYDSTSFGDSGTTLTIDLSSEKPSSADSICLYINAIYGVPASSITDPIILEFSNETTENQAV